MNGRSVSVIIPAFRAARTIGAPLDSLLAQIRLPDEIFVIDDGSPDDLYSTLKGYGDRITLVRKPNGGAASARNLGIERSKGDLIAFLDADDYWESIKLERQLAIFRDHPEVGLVASRFFEQPPGRPRVGPPAEAESPLRSGARRFGRGGVPGRDAGLDLYGHCPTGGAGEPSLRLGARARRGP